VKKPADDKTKAMAEVKTKTKVFGEKTD